MSYYAAQYLRIIVPANRATDRLNALSSNASVSQAQAVANQLVKADDGVDDAFLRASWPPAITADIRAEVTAFGPLLGDLANVTASTGTLDRDSGVANAAANITRAALGLPPVH
jgi:hypothetical protein